MTDTFNFYKTLRTDDYRTFGCSVLNFISLAEQKFSIVAPKLYDCTNPLIYVLLNDDYGKIRLIVLSKKNSPFFPLLLSSVCCSGDHLFVMCAQNRIKFPKPI